MSSRAVRLVSYDRMDGLGTQYAIVGTVRKIPATYELLLGLHNVWISHGTTSHCY